LAICIDQELSAVTTIDRRLGLGHWQLMIKGLSRLQGSGMGLGMGMVCGARGFEI